LLEYLPLAGALVTIDAGGATTRIAQTVLDRGGDYLLGLKKTGPPCSLRPRRCSLIRR